MSHCPSHDWDDHVHAEDAAMAAEAAWWAANQDRVTTVVSALIVATEARNITRSVDIKNLVDKAAEIVREITNHAEPL